ncbi:unnamed protein product, partial [Discosporangium mesarthrocarpum]
MTAPSLGRQWRLGMMILTAVLGSVAGVSVLSMMVSDRLTEGVWGIERTRERWGSIVDLPSGSCERTECAGNGQAGKCGVQLLFSLSRGTESLVTAFDVDPSVVEDGGFAVYPVHDHVLVATSLRSVLGREGPVYRLELTISLAPPPSAAEALTGEGELLVLLVEGCGLGVGHIEFQGITTPAPLENLPEQGRHTHHQRGNVREGGYPPDEGWGQKGAIARPPSHGQWDGISDWSAGVEEGGEGWARRQRLRLPPVMT